MGLIKARKDQPAPASSAGPPARLDAEDPAERRRAAHRMASRPEAVADLCARLAIEPDLSVREAILTSLVRGSVPEAVPALLPYLESEDAALRNAVIETVRAMPPAHVLPHIEAYLTHEDSDVRIFAVQLLAGLPYPGRIDRLTAVLEGEPHVNVCLAALDGLAELGRPEVLPSFDRLRTRFPDDPVVAFSVDAAHRRFAQG